LVAKFLGVIYLEVFTTMTLKGREKAAYGELADGHGGKIMLYFRLGF
jgi:hypothetical protein